MAIPTDQPLWSAVTVILIVIGQIINYGWQWFIHKRLNMVAEQTDGINKALRTTITKQDADKVATAKTTQRDIKTALRKKEKK